VGKEGNIAGELRLLAQLLSRTQTPHLLPPCSICTPLSRSKPSLVAMASNLSPSRLQTDNDLRRVRQLLGWQATDYDRRMWCGTIFLSGLQLGEFIFFTSYALAMLVLPVSSFFFTLLENYDLQLHHLTPHSLMLVVIFIHFCEMYVGVRSSVRLFELIHVL
jgi:hypothetical protein